MRIKVVSTPVPTWLRRLPLEFSFADTSLPNESRSPKFSAPACPSFGVPIFSQIERLLSAFLEKNGPRSIPLRLQRVGVISALVVFCTPLAFAQNTSTYDPVMDIASSPLRSYHGSDVDSIELATGMPSLNIPLISYPQRGGVLHLDYSLKYAGVAGNPSKALIRYMIPYGGGRQTWILSSYGQIGGLSNGGVTTSQNNFPLFKTVSTQTGTSSNYTQSWITEPDGSSHPLGWISVTQGRSLDGTGLFLTSVSPLTIVDKNGLTTSYNTSGNTIVADPNGNQITLAASSQITTDTLGRQIGFVGNPWTVPGPNGGTDTFTFGGSAANIQTVTLPNNTSYSFQFTATALPLLYGESTPDTIPLLTKIILPTGGSISYTYNPTALSTTCNGSSNYGFPVLVRSVDANDGRGPQNWT